MIKKYALVFEGKVACTYEDEKPQVFGGDWSKGQSLEIPEGIERPFFDGVSIIEKPKSQAELDEKTKDDEKKAAKELLKNIKDADLSTVAELRKAFKDLLKVVL